MFFPHVLYFPPTFQLMMALSFFHTVPVKDSGRSVKDSDYVVALCASTIHTVLSDFWRFSVLIVMTTPMKADLWRKYFWYYFLYSTYHCDCSRNTMVVFWFSIMTQGWSLTEREYRAWISGSLVTEFILCGKQERVINSLLTLLFCWLCLSTKELTQLWTVSPKGLQLGYFAASQNNTWRHIVSHDEWSTNSFTPSFNCVCVILTVK